MKQNGLGEVVNVRSRKITISETLQKNHHQHGWCPSWVGWMLLAAMIAWVPGCTFMTPEPGLHVLSESEVAALDLEDDLQFERLDEATRQSLRYYARLPDRRTFNYAGAKYTARELERSMNLLLDILGRQTQGDRLAEIRSKFQFYESRNRKGRAFFTGYYEPILPGSVELTERYTSPLYAMPEDLITVNLNRFPGDFGNKKLVGRLRGRSLIPFDDRATIVYQHSLESRAIPLAYLENDIEVFFLQIQGSGLVRLDNGTLLRLNYAGQNGHRYRAIGRLLRDQIPKEQMSLRSIKDYLYSHPEEVRRVLSYNKSYTFFRQVEEGPLGNIEVPLTPGRSVAMDRRLIPKGGLAYVETSYPEAEKSASHFRPLRRFMTVQDTGGAIRGYGRADIFFGHGLEAERLAGPMKQHGRIFLMVAKPKWVRPDSENVTTAWNNHGAEHL